MAIARGGNFAAAGRDLANGYSAAPGVAGGVPSGQPPNP